jgi:hypothetical protein
LSEQGVVLSFWGASALLVLLGLVLRP